ncbi:hypothetical protein HNR19_002671 [Nocardioides thalensis]|uniref:Uncharacterized protein n=1 Tax=Nocardioides thalensis TaxID=1914755 RepID=A0A853C6Z7_9ACTN|nr:hypothetical protein [Nocardioides thalensis]NYJ01973.1 hypothetical protein [Nocardioides thalensis]
MTPYEELATPAEMSAGAAAARDRMAARMSDAARKAVAPAPSIHYDDFPREVPKREIEISEAAQRLANALHLHLD